MLRPGLTVEDAADLAFLITSAENYVIATGTLSWSPERWRRTTATLLARVLIGETA
jgi:hypothetical protein